MYNIERFIEAQDKVYKKVVEELKSGKKRTHWMWFIFPQFVALGSSEISIYFGIKSVLEAKCYINNEILRNRYLECCNILLSLDNDDIEDILGEIDALKLRSSLTLFKFVDKDNEVLYQELLKKYYNGDECQLTHQLIKREL